MSQIILGILAIAAGAVFCFRGYLAMRAVIGVWGGFVGFGVGASLVAAFTQQPLLSGPLGWVAAIVGAALIGGLAYTFYAVAVILAMGSVGFGLGSGAAGLFALPQWMLVVAGVIGAGALIALAVVTNMPEVLLILVAASGGASAIVAGIALVMGLVPLSGAEQGALGEVLGEHWWLNVAYLVLLGAGIVTQLRRRSTANLRASYR